MPSYKQNPDIAYRRIDGEVLLVDADHHRMQQLNAVGGEVWVALEEERTLEELVARVCSRFEVSRAQATADIQAFLDKLASQSLIEVRP